MTDAELKDLTPEQLEKYNSLETDEEKKTFYDNIKLESNKGNVEETKPPAELDAKPKNQGKPGDLDPKEPYKIFETKEDHKSYMDKKTGSLKEKIKQLEASQKEDADKIKKLTNELHEAKNKKRIVFIKSDKKTIKKDNKKIEKKNRPAGLG